MAGTTRRDIEKAQARAERRNAAKRAAVSSANAALADPDPEGLPDLARALMAHAEYALARALLQRAYGRTEGAAARAALAQDWAISIYKDETLAPSVRFDEAIRILRTCAGFPARRDARSFIVAGGAHKAAWEALRRQEDLEAALAAYRGALEAGVAAEDGHAAINVAYVLDILAEREDVTARRTGFEDPGAARRRAEAHALRERVVHELGPHARREGAKATWGALVALAEALFGLRRHDEAAPLLARARDHPEVPGRDRKEVARRLATLAAQQRDMQGAEPPAALKAMEAFLGGNPGAVDAAFVGTVGLALSGGGFRASLYHIGVLAHLAEADLLRRVDVISCVSGGSVVGAHYYLELRHMLRTTPDEDVTREQYVEIVQRVQRAFLAGVQRNIRTRVVANPFLNLKMLASRYSRTYRLGELYEKELYARVEDGLGSRPRRMRDLLIHPAVRVEDGRIVQDTGFHPAEDNWRRAAKVPILVLNATTLNTGHNWQFTATWMGELPAGGDALVDSNDRLARLYYDTEAGPWKDLRLGYAVAGSSCVPGLFDPLALDRLYEGYLVRLVDGGVQDNQGTSSLLDQQCNVVIVSDASGQMGTQPTPSPQAIGVLLRTSSISQARVRVAEFEGVDAMQRVGSLDGLTFLHLKRGIYPRLVPGLHEKGRPAPLASEDGVGEVRHDVPVDRLELLSEVRTDLDSFTDIEAYSLMATAYRMARAAAPERAIGLPSPPVGSWDFLAVEKDLLRPTPTPRYQKRLEVASRSAFKIWFLKRGLQVVAAALALAALGAVGYLTVRYWDASIVTVKGLVIAVGILLVGLVLGKGVARALQPRRSVRQVALTWLVAFGGALAAWVHLLVFDRLFLQDGRVPLQPMAAATRSLDVQVPVPVRAGPEPQGPRLGSSRDLPATTSRARVPRRRA